jgi:hypothetical protein
MRTTPLGSALDPTTPAPSDLPDSSRDSLASRRTLLRPADRDPDRGVHDDERPAQDEHPPDGPFGAHPRRAEALEPITAAPRPKAIAPIPQFPNMRA